MQQSPEIELNTFMARLLSSLHKELNKYQGNPQNNQISNIDQTNEKYSCGQ